MEKTRSCGERVLIAIVVVAIIVCLIGLIALVLTSGALWAVYMTVGSFVVALIVIGVIGYDSKNDPAAGICTRPEPTTKPPTCRKVKVFKECFRCGKTIVVEVAEDIIRCDTTVKNIKAYCPACAELIEPGFCSKCGFPQPPPIRMRKEGEQKDEPPVYSNYCPHCGAPYENSKPRLPIPQHKRPLQPTYKTEGYDPDECNKK